MDNAPSFAWMDEQTFFRMLAAANEQGIVLRPAPRFRYAMLASSGTTSGVAYLITDKGCSCPAGAHGRPCKHRALYLRHHFTRLTKTYGHPAWARTSSSAA